MYNNQIIHKILYIAFFAKCAIIISKHRAGLPENSAARVRIVRRSVDARARMPRFLLRVAVGGEEKARK